MSEEKKKKETQPGYVEIIQALEKLNYEVMGIEKNQSLIFGDYIEIKIVVGSSR